MPLPYLNNWTTPSAPTPHAQPHLDTPPHRYDLNFAGGLVPSTDLTTDKVTLIPFIPSLHARYFYEEIKEEKTLMRLMPYPKNMADGLEDLLQGVEISMRSVPVSFEAQVVCFSRRLLIHRG
jgi:hypothetical protein